ncbi:MAG: cytochrome c oxidase accessory protein CcoG [Balneolaceae bacterium]
MANKKDRRIDRESFRDHLSTVNKEGKRNWIFPTKPSGRHYKARNIVAFLLLVFFFSGPFITINGHPLLLLNILERKFVIFGMAFWPQDLHLLVFGALSLIIFIVLFTAVFGRLWCGWACPQTIFMEMVFRRVEYWIEGDRASQIRLNRSPWNWNKVWRKTLKHGVFFGMAFLISNLFLAYIIGKDELFTIITDPPSQHLGGLIAITIFSGVFYGVFAFLREQVCHFICPYGRMQSVLLDNNSINVMYDYVRGEPRASVKDRNKMAGKATLEDLGLSPEESFGDCIDCHQCVRVCPMGIDIRNGTQLECIHCTACIDACDHVMDKIDKPRGLIRYSSENAIREGTKKILTPRVAGYSGILAVLLITFFTLLVTRPDTETSILREPGTLYQKLPNDRYSNIYEIKVINKTFKAIDYDVKLEHPEGELTPLGNFTNVPAQGSTEGRFLIKLDQDRLSGSRTDIEFSVYANGRKVETISSGFIGPEPKHKGLEEDDD